MKSKRNVLLCLTILALSLSILSIGLWASSVFGNTGRHILYVGTNDKNTLQAELSVEDARMAISDACAKHGVDYTLMEGDGVWTNAENEITEESTFALIIYGASDETISAVCTDLLGVLNQESVLIEKSRVETQFFSG